MRTALSLGPQQGWKVPIVKTEASKGIGVAELLTQIDAHGAFIEEEGTLEQRRARNLRNEVLALAAARTKRELETLAAEDAEVAALLERVVKRELDPANAARELMERQRGD